MSTFKDVKQLNENIHKMRLNPHKVPITFVLHSFMKWSVSYGPKTLHGRDVGKHRLLYSQILGRANARHWESGDPIAGRTKEVCFRIHKQVLLLRVRVEYISEKCFGGYR